MKILIVHNRYRHRGGEDSAFEAECEMLERAGHVVLRYERDNGDIHRGLGSLATAARTLWNPRTYREIRGLIRRERPDIVHCHNTFPLVSPSVYYAAAAERVPVVQTLHNYRLACLNGYLFRDGHVCERCLGRCPLPGIRRRCYRGSRTASAAVALLLVVHRCLGTFRRRVTRYIALTDFGRELFVKAGLPAGKIVVKPNVCRTPFPNAESEPPPLPSGAGLDAHVTTFLYLGRLSPEKGVSLLLDAWRLVQQTPPSPAPGSLRLLLAGEGPEREALEARSADLPGVTFLGAIPGERLPGLFAETTILVSPSITQETFGLAIVEAAAAGRPALVSDLGAQRTLVKDGTTGVLFPAGDAPALASAIRALAASPQRAAAMGQAARAAFLAGPFTPDRNVEALVAIYRDCIIGS